VVIVNYKAASQARSA